MRFPLRAIFIGLVVGAALFFFPFGIPILFFFFFIFILSRLFFGWRRWGYYDRGWRHRYGSPYYNGTVPIDGNDLYQRSPMGGDERKITIE